jgi:DNA-binding NtrC family response regulator
MATILCIDDEPSVGVALEQTLQQIGHETRLAQSVEAGMDVLGRVAVDLIISDYRMPGASGLDLIARLQKEGYRIPVIMLTGFSSIEHAVIAIKSGAIDYLTKPIRPETLEIAVNQALELIRLQRENEAFRHEMAAHRSSREIVGESAALKRVMETIAAVAPTRATVLLEGESGTGKELFAHAIHDQSPRRDRPFVSLNCAALPEGLVESALFGHERGAFTGATMRNAGAFERAHRGTLLLDEVSEMRLDLQAKLLRVLQEHQFERVGGQATIAVDVRLIATTNHDLRAAAEEGKFRGDLYYRLAVMPIRTPAFRERLEDLPLLLRYFARRSAQEIGVPVPVVKPETVALLRRHTWPGNIRELANVVERAVILTRGGVLGPEAFESHLFAVTPPGREAASPLRAPAPAPAPSAAEDVIPPDLCDLEEIERIVIERALRATRGNRTRAAGLLGISERTLRNKLNTPQPTA